ncbi:hypothetical protein Metev_2310 (plasmid) [Methanohalobium evestigatum Z-7303]|uniref:Uncharacterized protein n=1 Tax=Methanohalobium evestigatum (strain ATCC BAA-1072 / DSM 3721 / NBRC 107634 / OCM 161 / Z-7303) TaxID=644295 RepID=D7EC00_METEZ|nr:hypothetical protein [Methanohalobium evestigatum]ADI75122.1 hypothetical protein Metev_2310 [Methanohalobium evestigatum Z-7303]
MIEETIDLNPIDLDEDLDVSSVDVEIEIDWDDLTEKILDLYTEGFDIDEIIQKLKSEESNYIKLNQLA